jgi:hypothetical protein
MRYPSEERHDYVAIAAVMDGSFTTGDPDSRGIDLESVAVALHSIRILDFPIHRMSTIWVLLPSDPSGALPSP